jgi:hypothetical protein
MYVRLVAVAAAIILVVLLYPFSNETLINVGSANHISASLKSLSGKKISNLPSEDPNTLKNVNYSHVGTENSGLENNTVNENQDYSFAVIDKLNFKKISSSSFSKNHYYEPEELDQAFYINKKQKGLQVEENETNTYLSFSDMKNPAPVVTNGLKERLQKEVDFRSARATRNKQGGFFIKIGKFEISRKTAPVNSDILATN